MDVQKQSDSNAKKNPTTVERKSDRELVVTRTFNGPVRAVWKAWTQADLFARWWVPKSFPITVVSCELDVRTGGRYRLVMSHPAHPQPMAFFGRYTDVVPNQRIVWTNEEAGDAGQVTTVTFEEVNGQTRVVMTDLYPTKDALDEACANGSTSGVNETFEQLATILPTLQPNA